MRLGVQVREALPGDMESLVALCLAARREAAVGAQLCTDDADRLRDQLGALLAARGGRVLVAFLDDEPAGLLLARVVGPGPFTDLVSLDIEAIYVLPTARRRGLGHALLVGATTVADEAGATEMYSSPLPGARGMQRFLARLGFAPAASHRVVTTAALQRKLTHESGHVGAPGSVRRSGPRGLEDLIARRRQARAARQPVVEEPVAPARSSGADQGRASITMQVNRAVQSGRPSSSSTTTW
ncbi:GNAT family N-acetyltransferase [Cellulomonas humilata]|uniref:GNAT superfamily N-acetyltransferase n=1 Tax=Cellulomonas humilata TaxID=144055 RepID=A0ABU0EHC9_9CELL|nr:GNAT family N-acetyltransferase [Cellulomonas humilata]MDQ0374690.1 GNAT superfamily N-acetyltransferase [Cellulomonas humilata]